MFFDLVVDILVTRDSSLGAGLYSFFNNYTQTCLTTRDCQNQIADIDSDSDVHIYSLSTVATSYQVSVDGAGIVKAEDNLNGFASTVTLWKGWSCDWRDRGGQQ